MPFAGAEVRWDLACGPGADGRWHGWFAVYVDGGAARRLGLHPSRPSSVVDGPSPPAWWHAAGERYGRRWPLPPAPVDVNRPGTCEDPSITAPAPGVAR